tara:strand:+ start:156 stop:431 length:276 start_codon:yes stop_codon:yes gene_type:complete
MNNLENEFEECANLVKSGSWGNKVPHDRKLKLYAFYKRSTVGENTTPQPWSVQIEARAKWDAWKSIEKISKVDAMNLYIKEYKSQLEDFGN